ncbi:hypothetical protein DM02DRAFT_666381 [Periconia macrospinosa]|uniref:Uncharacterized protein n=1 Tax=Periconia macrospinosa TaxID=97972 RepID=A0A2V1EE24_9PLEO|nr:hypothetical protein DM02DRAFT_666381 [Periconia macrospinosa]
MFIKSLIITFFSASVLGTQFYQNVEHDFGVMLARGEAMLEKRQGYYPTTRLCGSGRTCAEACGAGTEQCPASKSGLYCYEPARSRCCQDGSGNACRIGYYCTTDGKASPRTYCCPDGVDLGACAQSYSLTISLIRASSTFVPSSSPSSLPSAIRSSSVLTSGAVIATPSGTRATPTVPTTSIVLPTANTPVIPTSNGSFTTSPPAQFSNVAAKMKGAGIAALAGVAGFAGVL